MKKNYILIIFIIGNVALGQVQNFVKLAVKSHKHDSLYLASLFSAAALKDYLELDKKDLLKMQEIITEDYPKTINFYNESYLLKYNKTIFNGNIESKISALDILEKKYDQLIKLNKNIRNIPTEALIRKKDSKQIILEILDYTSLYESCLKKKDSLKTILIESKYSNFIKLKTYKTLIRS